MLMLPMWSLADGMNTTPLWMTVYYTITYALIYLALILCLYSGGEYLVNTFGGRKKTAKSGKGNQVNPDERIRKFVDRGQPIAMR